MQFIKLSCKLLLAILCVFTGVQIYCLLCFQIVCVSAIQYNMIGSDALAESLSSRKFQVNATLFPKSIAVVRFTKMQADLFSHF